MFTCHLFSLQIAIEHKTPKGLRESCFCSTTTVKLANSWEYNNCREISNNGRDYWEISFELLQERLFNCCQAQLNRSFVGLDDFVLSWCHKPYRFKKIIKSQVRRDTFKNWKNSNATGKEIYKILFFVFNLILTWHRKHYLLLLKESMTEPRFYYTIYGKILFCNIPLLIFLF